MSLFNKIFGNSNPGQPPVNPNVQGQPGQPMPQPTNNLLNNPAPTGTHQSSGTANNGVVPQEGNLPAPELSPLDKFAKIWETTPVDPNNKPSPDNAVTPEKMMEAASKVDFTRVIDQESLAQIAAGGDGAVKALVAIINKTSQTVYGQSSVVAKKLVDQAVESATQDFTSRLPGLVRQQSLKDNMLNDNPAFKDPAVAPIVEALQQQFAQKYPQASANELNKMAQEYFAGAAAVMAPQKPDKSSVKTAVDETDWDSWVQTPTPI